jgi:hypothetical protein
MNEKTKENIQILKKAIESDKLLKTAVYIGIGVLSLYLLGKAFNGLATTVRGFNNLKSALNGN